MVNRKMIFQSVVLYGAHSLRHYFATQALSAGMPSEIVKRITGHSSDAMLEGYEHVDARMIGALVAKLGDAVPVKALPPPRTVEVESVRKLAEGMSAKNWRVVRDAMLALAGA